jgi:hypothetical protein
MENMDKSHQQADTKRASCIGALIAVRVMVANLGLTIEQAANNPAIPVECREYIILQLEKESNIILEPARSVSVQGGDDWFRRTDRSKWYYWPELRGYLLSRGLLPQAVQSLDESTDKILSKLTSPDTQSFDIRGLVLGYVQSGKTANFTATIAKAADCGYRLFIVLSGIDKGLRRQTQVRLERELMGYGITSEDPNHVPIPPQGKQWHRFTNNDIDGDFDPGNANQASLQGPEPVMMVVKKNGTVLRRVLKWLSEAQEDTLREIPTVIIDDEADLASIDTRGSYQTEDEDVNTEDYEPPSVINGLIRELIRKFRKITYIAYTATPFANILIPHDTYDPNALNDLYPKDFIVDLPKPYGYYGAAELFGLVDSETNTENQGLGVIRIVEDQDIIELETGNVPPSLEAAMLGFVLSGSARSFRSESDSPSTMLVHTSHRIESHMNVTATVKNKFNEFRDNWRYYRDQFKPKLKELWDRDFRTTTQSTLPGKDIEFEEIVPLLGNFFESVDVRTINSFTGAVLDYDREPSIKAIGIGGNKLSRGLTLEGLTTSYFVRKSPAYDTLMQMGRWFGFREGYQDLTRIWTTRELADRFVLLATVEQSLREDIRVYEDMQVKPSEVGMRIMQNPAMQVTSYLKRRFANKVEISQSYSEQLAQTFKFQFDRPDDLAAQQDANVELLERFLEKLGDPEWDGQRPLWRNVKGELILDFLSGYQQSDSPESSGCSMPLICRYIENQQRINELVHWVVSVRGRETEDSELGETRWRAGGKPVWQISRSRIRGTYSLGVITSPGDEKTGLSEDLLSRVSEIRENAGDIGENRAVRRVRPKEEGLLLIYPISRYSQPEPRFLSSREAIYENPDSPNARDLIGLAISFPSSPQPQPVRAYLEGTVRWRPYDERP